MQAVQAAAICPRSWLMSRQAFSFQPGKTKAQRGYSSHRPLRAPSFMAMLRASASCMWRPHIPRHADLQRQRITEADGTCGSSGWLKALSGNSSVQALLDRALTSASTPCANTCVVATRALCTHTSADAEPGGTRVSADAYRSANGADESVHNDAVWAPRMVAPVTSKALPREYAIAHVARGERPHGQRGACLGDR